MGTLEQARAARQRFGLLYVGFVLTAGDPYCVIDLDAPLTAMHEDVRIRFAATYQEWSVSERGIHIVCRAAVPGGGVKARKVELYSDKRYMICTGSHIEGTGLLVENCQPQVDVLCAELRPPRETPPRTLPKQSDHVVLQLTLRSGRAAMLYRGGDPFGDPSAADYALCASFARYSSDPEQIARLFKASPLGERAKVQRREDYADRTARAAIEKVGGWT